MEPVSVLERAAGVDLAGADRAAVCSMFADLARLSAWIEARRIAGVRRLDELPDVRFADTAVSDATRESTRDAQRTVKRAATLALFARLDKALEAGEITTAHVDAVTNGLADVPEARRASFIAEEDRLLDAARRLGVESFARTVRDVVRRLLSTEDAKDRLRRQKRATRLAVWKNTIGMICLRGCFDPETGAELIARLESAKQQLFPDRNNLPDTTPSDPGEREDHLRALTLAALMLGGGGVAGWRPETLLVIDEETLHKGRHDETIVDAGIDVDLPDDALRRLTPHGQTVRVTMRNGVVTSIDGRTNLDRGRSRRLADIDQRRALRAMYPTCAMPDCPVRFRHCQIHHIEPWKPGGCTDLDKLVPICDRHHDAIHQRGWTLKLDRERTLTVTRSDGNVTVTPPPYAHAA